MKNATMIEIKHVENSFEALDLIEVDLQGILHEEYGQGLPNDIDNPA